MPRKRQIGPCPRCISEALEDVRPIEKGGFCHRHYGRALMRRYRETPEGRAKGQAAIRKYRKTEKGKASQERWAAKRAAEKSGYCVECEREGKDPAHGGRYALCNAHYRKRWRETKAGKKSAADSRKRWAKSAKGKQRRVQERESPIARAVREAAERDA